MKKIICVLFALCTLAGTALSQNQQATTTFTIDTGWPLLGNYNYSYYLDNSGNAVLNGPFSVVGKESVSGIEYKYFYQASVNGTYNLTGTAKDGMMHGPLALKSNIKISATNGDSSNYTYVLNGNFNNGYPHGAFNLSYIDDLNTTVNVNYKNGILVGNYKVCALVDNMFTDISGTFSQEGKMTGVWKYGGTNEETYVNGVRISKVNVKEGKGTPPAMIEKARAYALGQVTKEQLKADNIYVRTDSMDFGKTAWAVILRRDIINWDKLPGYIFSKSAYVQYEYLQQKQFFSDLGFNTLAKELAAAICDDRMSINGLTAYPGSNKLYRRYIAVDKECNMPFVEMHKSSEWMQFVTGTKDVNIYYFHVYLTDQQIKILDQEIFNYQKTNIVKLTDLILNKASHLKGSLLFYYLDKNLDQCQNLYQITTLDKDLKDIYARFKDAITISSIDSQYCIYTGENKQAMLTLDSWANLAVQAGGYEDLLSQVPETYKQTLEGKRKEWELFRHDFYKKQVNKIGKVVFTEYESNYELEQWISKGYEGTPTPDVLAAAQSKFKTLYNNLKRCEFDSDYMVYSLNGNIVSYLNLKDVYEFAYNCGLTDLILADNTNDSDKAIFENLIKEQKEKDVHRIKERVDEIFKFLMNKYSSDFTNMYEVEKYVAFDGYESHQYRDAFMSHMLLFTPIVAYEVKDIYGDNLEKVDCIITVEGLFKKTPYQITLTIVNNKVLIKSFDKDNVKKVK